MMGHLLVVERVVAKVPRMMCKILNSPTRIHTSLCVFLSLSMSHDASDDVLQSVLVSSAARLLVISTRDALTSVADRRNL